jgi:hypothetical protein
MKRLILGFVLITGTTAFAADTPAVIGHLETRNRVVTIFAGEQPHYSVSTKEGKMLAEHISLRELSAKFPDLHRTVDGSYATWAGL